MTIHIFYSYSHKDKHHKGDLEKHLSTLKIDNKISSCSDYLIPGT